MQCDQVNFKDESLVEAEFLNNVLTSKEKVKTYCFCREKLFSADFITSRDYQFSSGEKPCFNMVIDILTFNGYSLGISLLIPALNAILLIILRGI